MGPLSGPAGKVPPVGEEKVDLPNFLNTGGVEIEPLVEKLNDHSLLLELRLKSCLESAREYLQAERGCLMITYPGHETMVYVGDEDLNLKFPFSRDVVGRAMIGGTGLVSFQSTDKLRGDSSASMKVHGVRAALCAPLLGPGEEDYGVIYFDTRMGGALFKPEQLKPVQGLAEEICRVLSVAQDNN